MFGGNAGVLNPGFSGLWFPDVNDTAVLALDYEIPLHMPQLASGGIVIHCQFSRGKGGEIHKGYTVRSGRFDRF
jgi:hypothetical protein